MLPQLQKLYRGNNRQGRTMFGQKNHVQDPHLTTQELLNYHKLANEGRIEDITAHIRQKRQGNLGSLKTKHTNSISCRPPPGVYGTLQLSKDIQGVQASFKLVTMQYWSVSNPKVARTPCSTAF